MDYKICGRCHQRKPVTDFYKNRRAKDGYNIYCKACDRKRKREARKRYTHRIVLTEKKCSRCHKVFPIDNFTKNKAMKDGYGNYCASCRTLINREKKARRKARNAAKSVHELPKTQICTSCGRERPRDMFYRDNSTTSGLNRWCKDCIKEHRGDYFKAWEAANSVDRQGTKRVQYLNALNTFQKRIIKELGVPPLCTHCGFEFEHLSQMALHHRNPKTKEFSISSMLKRNPNNINWTVLKEELQKCDLVCHNCHTILTFPDFVKFSNYRAIVKEDIINQLGNKCEICGKSIKDFHGNLAPFHFHHLSREEKLFNVSTYLDAGFGTDKYNKLLKEASKCVVLCANCHALEHAHIREGKPSLLINGDGPLQNI